jgi:AmmeMemoRadiSam system protein B
MNDIRPSVIAGSWYPGSRIELEETIKSFFEKVKLKTFSGEIIGLISPHAGYVYSGQTAAYAFKQLHGKEFDVVAVLSPLHQPIAGPYVVNDSDYYETPLGKVPIDTELVEKLSKEISLTKVQFDQEHSLEIQLPFLQVVLQNFKLLPVMIGHGDVFNTTDLVSALLNVFKGKRILVIASSDMHHISNYHEVHERDREILELLSTFHLDDIRKGLSRFECSVCGRVPISAVLDLSKQLGANRLEILHHTTSGDVTGDKRPGQYTVGYLAAALIK